MWPFKPKADQVAWARAVERRGEDLRRLSDLAAGWGAAADLLEMAPPTEVGLGQASALRECADQLRKVAGIRGA